MKRFLFVLPVIFLFSCNTGERNPMPVIPENSTGDYGTVFLFEIEGVKVYRFHDSGQYHYLAIGPNVQNVQTVQSRIRPVGKTTITEYWNDNALYIKGEER